MALEARDQSLQAEVAAGILQRKALLESLAGASNRIDEVARQLDVEKKTNDPIRRQIEDMLVEQISLKDKLGKREKAAAGLDATLSGVRKEYQDLRVQFDGQRDHLAQLEKELKEKSEREAAAQSQLGEAHSNLADMKTKLDEAQRRLADSERLASELKKAKQALETVATTNAVQE